MTIAKRQELAKMFFIILWLVFTVTFAFWWFRFSLSNISLLTQLEPAQGEHWERLRRMIFWEGSTWIVLLALGGGALIALVLREGRRTRRIREFFASFSHEVKTSLASLRLQAEALKDDTPTESPVLDRLIADTVRLQLQLENSLFMASHDNLQLFQESVRLQELLDRMREQWPSLQIELHGACVLQGDARALRTIFSNLMQNAIVHGGAKKVAVRVEPIGSSQVSIRVSDDGRGFSGGDTKALGQLFFRPTSRSGSGLGLYICRLLAQKMHGALEVDNLEGDAAHGFQVRLRLIGALA